MGIQLVERVGKIVIYKDVRTKADDDAPQGQPSVKVFTTMDSLIRHTAHCLWEFAGRPDGLADMFWHQAENFIRAEGIDIDERRAMERGYFYCPHPTPVGGFYQGPDAHQQLSDFAINGL